MLAGEKTVEQIMLNDLDWYAERGITLHAGREVTRINRARREVIAADGTVAPYDRLLLATGSDPIILPVPGNDLPGVITFRDIQDVRAMLDAARAGRKHAVVIGGGLLGLEAANGLMKQGMEVTVVHLLGVLMERQFDTEAAALLRTSLEERGLRVCANHLAHFGISRYRGSVTSTKLKVTGIDVFSAGEFGGGPGCDAIVLRDQARGVYKKLVVQDNRVKGAVLYGDTIDGSWYFQLLRENTDIGGFRDSILFGQAHLGDAGHGGGNNVLAMPDDAEICGCNGVCKGAIVKAITAQKLFTLEEVRAHTKASASCGSCTGLVEQLLAATVGDYSKTSKEKPLCACTEHSHDQVRKTIREHHLTSLRAVFDFMEWKTPDGCHSCRPAINFYLIAAWPGEAQDDAQSRFINERVHANIQKDGTYSVVPRLWGGLTNPKELRAIADVAEKFQIPTVKVTSGQRIDLLGVKKEDLPKVWADLNAAGMVSGHAYGKSLRTVKTCVGSEWCRFGTQDSTGLGVKLEQMTWGSWTPHKFKMAVSGCPRNCAEATIKDFGVVCVDSGYELHVGGNGGIKLRGTELLGKVATEEEVMEYAGAFMQLYREEARYLERTALWLERVGLAYVKQRIVEDEEGRKALHARFLESQQYAQIDPWAERASGRVAAHEFEPLRRVG